MTNKNELKAIESANATMESALDELTVAIKAVESELRVKSKLKARVKTQIPAEDKEDERHFLVWALNDKTGWSLHLMTRLEGAEDRFTLLVQAPWRLRVRATECLDALIVQAAIELRQRNKEVIEAIHRCESFATKLRSRSDEEA